MLFNRPRDIFICCRMMMLEDEQISFRSDSDLYDNVEDYSHRIAEMIGQRNASYLVQVGVS